MAQLRHLLLLVLLLVLSLAGGCVLSPAQSSDDELDTSPTPECTCSPPPAVADDTYYRVTEMVVADGSNGNCGVVECSSELQGLLDLIHQTIYDQVEAELCGAEPCTGNDAVVLQQIDALLEAVLDVDTLSAALNNPIQQGSINLFGEIEEASAGSSAYTLTFCSGTFKSTGWTVGSCTEPDPGTLDAQGTLVFDATTIPLTFTITDSKGHVLFTYTIELDVYSVTVPGYNTVKLSNVLIVGALSEEDILELTNEVIDAINDILVVAGKTPIETQEVDTQILENLEPYLTLDTDKDGVEDALEIDLMTQMEVVNIVQ